MYIAGDVQIAERPPVIRRTANDSALSRDDQLDLAEVRSQPALNRGDRKFVTM